MTFFVWNWADGLWSRNWTFQRTHWKQVNSWETLRVAIKDPQFLQNEDSFVNSVSGHRQWSNLDLVSNEFAESLSASVYQDRCCNFGNFQPNLIYLLALGFEICLRQLFFIYMFNVLPSTKFKHVVEAISRQVSRIRRLASPKLYKCLILASSVNNIDKTLLECPLVITSSQLGHITWIRQQATDDKVHHLHVQILTAFDHFLDNSMVVVP